MGEDLTAVDRIILTASGGALRDWPMDRLAHATLAETLAEASLEGTTTIRLLLGLIRATSGRAEVFGVDCQADPVEAHRSVSRVAGHFAGGAGIVGRHLAADVVGAQEARALRQDHHMAMRFADVVQPRARHGQQVDMHAHKGLVHARERQ